MRGVKSYFSDILRDTLYIENAFLEDTPGDESEKLWTKCDNEKVSLDLDCGLDVDQYGL